MKRFGSLLIVAFLGGLISVSAYCLITKRTVNVAGVPAAQIPAQLASYSSVSDGQLLPDFTVAANMTIHAVVHIKTEYARKNSMYDNFFDLRDFFGGQTPNNQQEPIMASGSGVIISQDGYIVTNNHVVQDATNISVTLNDKRTYSATVIGTDPSTDLALIKIDESALPFIAYGNSDDVKIGEWVLAVGNPFNLTSTVTAGIVSAKARNINILGTPDGSAIESFIQTDAAVNRGNSGGALVNTRGELIGINAAIASGNGFYAGYSFAIPVNIVKKVVADMMEFGEVQRAFIGVSIREVDSKLAKDEGLNELRGVYVAEVSDNGSAKEAGIRSGDIIVSIDGMPVNSSSELLEIIGQHSPGDKVNLSVSRDGKEMVYNVKLLNKEGTTQVVKKEVQGVDDLLGATFSTAPADLMQKLGIDHGVQVASLSNGILLEAGIRQGFVITEIDKKPVFASTDIKKALQNKSGGVLIEGVYPNRTRAYYGFGL
ncbi:MAG: Do family serine endopeptidase [Bacteroidota bacterium]